MPSEPTTAGRDPAREFSRWFLSQPLYRQSAFVKDWLIAHPIEARADADATILRLHEALSAARVVMKQLMRWAGLPQTQEDRIAVWLEDTDPLALTAPAASEAEARTLAPLRDERDRLLRVVKALVYSNRGDEKPWAEALGVLYDYGITKAVVDDAATKDEPKP